MLITEDTAEGSYLIRAYEPGKIIINQNTYEHSLIITPTTLITDWEPQSFNELKQQHLELVLQFKPDIVIIGTGTKFKLLSNDLLTPFTSSHTGIESMDTGAACRTFMALLGEGRNVVAALLIE